MINELIAATGVTLVWAFIAAPIGPPLTYYFAVNDSILGALLAGAFSIVNTVLLVVLTYHLSKAHVDRKKEK